MPPPSDRLATVSGPLSRTVRLSTTAFSRLMLQPSHSDSRLDRRLWKAGWQSPLPTQAGQCTGAASFRSSGIARANLRRPLVSEIGPRRRALLGPLLGLHLSRNKPGRSLSAPCRAALSAYLPAPIFLSISAAIRQPTASHHRLIVPFPAQSGALLYRCFAHSGPSRLSGKLRNY
jgi:hypothetical protein